MRLTNEELRLINFLLWAEFESFSKWLPKDSPHTMEEFSSAIEALAEKISDIQCRRKSSIPLEVDKALNCVIEAHKKKQLVLSTPSSVGPEIT